VWSRLDRESIPVFPIPPPILGIAALKAISDGEKPTNMRKKYFDWEYVFEFVWKNADRDGMWDGNASTVAAEFGVSEPEAHSALDDLADRGLIEKLSQGNHAIVKWRERDDPGKEESAS
jgi:hypothetical protein